MKPIFEFKFEEDIERDAWRLMSDPILQNMQDNFANLVLAAEEEWWVGRVVEVLELKGYVITKGGVSDRDV